MTHPVAEPLTEHRTLVLGRTFEVPVTRVYAAVSEPLERALIGTLGDDHVVLIDESDFRIGGRDLFRFGPRRAPAFTAEALFHQIVPQSLIVSTEIVHAGEICISVELVSLALTDRGGETDLKLTAQVLSLSGNESLTDAASYRHQAFIEGLARHLGTPGHDRRRPVSRR